MLVKVHNSYRKTIAICDSNLINKKFEQGNRELDLTTSFYKGEEKTTEEVERIIEFNSAEDSTFNIIGKEAVELALKKGIIRKDGITEIQGIPVALALL